MCHSPLSDPSFYNLLLRLDRAILDESPDRCSSCGARLDAGDYPRKPRGVPPGVSPSWSIRFSLCCSRDGCRKRLTPFSVRFLARRVYVGVVVILVSLGRDGLTATRVRHLQERTGLSMRTIERWLAWWRETFPASRFWTAHRSAFAGSIETHHLPDSLFAHFAGTLLGDRLMALLEFLSPITSRSAPGSLAL
jgi:hypothetical protein